MKSSNGSIPRRHLTFQLRSGKTYTMGTGSDLTGLLPRAAAELFARPGKSMQNNNCHFANFWRSRSQLYQNEILQENMRLTTFFKLYKICILLHRCNLKILAKNRFEKSAIFVKFQQKIANVAKFAKFCHFSKFSAA